MLYQRPASLARAAVISAAAEPPQELGRSRGPVAQPIPVIPPGEALIFFVYEATHRLKSVVGNFARPHQFPQGFLGIAGISAASRLVQRSEKRRALPRQHFEDAERLLAQLHVLCG